MINCGIILLGLRCSGKSTIAPKLASLLAVPAVDLDDRAAALLGCESAAAAIHDRGLETFRDAEVDALWRELSGQTARRGVILPGVPAPLVLSLGGGTPTAPGAEPILRSASSCGWLLVYLRATAATLQSRTARSPRGVRPSLTGRDPVDEVAALLAQRDGPYRRLAELTIEVDDLSVGQVVDQIIDFER